MLRNPISLSHFKTYALLAHTVPLNSFTYSIFICSVCDHECVESSEAAQQSHTFCFIIVHIQSLIMHRDQQHCWIIVWMAYSLCSVLSSHWCSFTNALFYSISAFEKEESPDVSPQEPHLLLQWPSSSASCSSQPIRCCGMVWSSPAHCEPCWPLLRNMHQKLTFF